VPMMNSVPMGLSYELELGFGLACYNEHKLTVKG
jgi:hypothetical protein